MVAIGWMDVSWCSCWWEFSDGVAWAGVVVMVESLMAVNVAVASNLVQDIRDGVMVECPLPAEFISVNKPVSQGLGQFEGTARGEKVTSSFPLVPAFQRRHGLIGGHSGVVAGADGSVKIIS